MKKLYLFVLLFSFISFGFTKEYEVIGKGASRLFVKNRIREVAKVDFSIVEITQYFKEVERNILKNTGYNFNNFKVGCYLNNLYGAYEFKMFEKVGSNRYNRKQFEKYINEIDADIADNGLEEKILEVCNNI